MADKMSEDASLFKQSLFTQYKELQLRESAEGNIVAANIYSAKAKRSLSGDEPVMQFDSWHLTPEGGKLVKSSFDRLQRLLSRPILRIAPHESARAIAMYDCWLEEESEAVDPDEAAACRLSFFSAVNYLETLRLSSQQVRN